MKTVREIMATDVINVRPEITVRELAQVLSDAQISGVPVVNSQQELVGVVSATDIVRFASEPPARDEPATSTWAPDADETLPDYVPSFFREADVYAGSWTPLDVEAAPSTLDDATVSDIMTSVPFTVPADTSVALLAQFLSERRIHRALVTSPSGLAGIVTTFDVLRACHEMLNPTPEA